METLVIRRTTTHLCLCLIALQALIPGGYMPTAVGSGWFLQLCPQGVSAAVMAVLHGNHHAASHTGGDSDAHAAHSPIEQVPTRGHAHHFEHHSGHHADAVENNSAHALQNATALAPAEAQMASWSNCDFALFIDSGLIAPAEVSNLFLIAVRETLRPSIRALPAPGGFRSPQRTRAPPKLFLT